MTQLTLTKKAKALNNVKFLADETGGTDDKENSAVLHIIDHLENTLGTENSMDESPSQVSTSVFHFINLHTVVIFICDGHLFLHLYIDRMTMLCM